MATPPSLALIAFVATVLPAVAEGGQKQSGETVARRCFVLELYVSSYDESSQSIKAQMEAFVAKNAGYALRIFDTESDPQADDRLDRICRQCNRNHDPGTTTMVGNVRLAGQGVPPESGRR